MLYGSEYSTWIKDNPQCGGCGKRFAEESLTWMPTWKFQACPACVIECNRVDQEETGCTTHEIAVKPTPVGIGFAGYVPGHEEKYGSCYGRTPMAAKQAMADWIEFKDNKPELPRVTVKPVRLAETAQGNLFGKDVA